MFCNIWCVLKALAAHYHLKVGNKNALGSLAN